MSDVSKELVTVFFELNGFFVKRDTSLLIRKTHPGRTRSGNFVLSVEDINKIQQAIVDAKPWHTEVFFPSVITSSAEIFNFLEQEKLKEAERFFETNNFKKIIVVSKLPTVKETLKKSVVTLKQGGIDHAIEFSTILAYLTNYVKTNVNYVTSDLLQLIRIFKCYGFYRPPQLELFTTLEKAQRGKR